MPAAEVPGIFCRAIQHSFPAVTSFVDIHRAIPVPGPAVVGIPAISFHEAAEVIMSAAVADDLATVQKISKTKPKVWCSPALFLSGKAFRS